MPADPGRAGERHPLVAIRGRDVDDRDPGRHAPRGWRIAGRALHRCLDQRL